MENIIEHPFFRFYFDDPFPLLSIDICETDFKRACDALYSIIPCSIKFVRYNYFLNIY